jgi:hypothetical protein
MLKAVKKLFDWTPSDIAAWERIRQRGLWHFVQWYGLAFSGIMFIVMGTVTFFTWTQTPASLASLLFQLVFVAIVCLLGGLITSLVTWWMEESIYRKITQSRLPH